MARSSFTFSLRGVRGIQDRFRELRELPDKLDQLVEAAAYDTNDDAISNIQREGAQDLGAGGGLLSHQYVQAKGPHSWTVGNSAFYAPFIEWGTGRQVHVPPEMQQYAAQFKGPYPGTWKEFEENIRAWMQRHNIPQDKTYPIMHAILQRGLPARPFLWPAFIKNREELLRKVRELLR